MERGTGVCLGATRMMIGSSDEEVWKDRDDQESRRMGMELARDRESQGALKKFGSVLINGFLRFLI